MSKEGKLSRAMAKVAGTKAVPKHTNKPDEKSAHPHVLSEVRLLQPDFRKVRGRCGPIASRAAVIYDAHGEVAVQIRGIRARILAMDGGKVPCAIAISSGSRAEGKTTIAVNLALSLCEIGSGRVLLIDGDMLRPSVHQVVNIRATSGLTDILSNASLDLNDNVYETVLPNLDVVPTRAVMKTQGAGGPLHHYCGELLAKLRKYYSFIIIDTPPVLAGSQAATFGKHCDGVVLVARMEKTSRHVVKRGAEELGKAGVRIIGCILTHQKHHVPDFIYRFLGTTSAHYYRYGGTARDRKTDADIPRGSESHADE